MGRPVSCCTVMLYSFQSEHSSLDSDYNGMQAVSSVTAPGASDGQVEEVEEEVEEEVFLLPAGHGVQFRFRLADFGRDKTSLGSLAD